MTVAVFQIRSGSRAGRRLRVPEWPVVIGRAETCDLRVQDHQASRLHCELLYEGDGVVVRDLRSRNGTFVNGNRIHEATILKIGDHLRVGKLELELVAVPNEKEPSEAPPEENTTADLSRMTIDELVQFDDDLAVPLSEPSPAAGAAEDAAPESLGNHGTTIVSGESLKSPDKSGTNAENPAASVESTRDAARQALRKLFHGRA